MAVACARATSGVLACAIAEAAACRDDTIHYDCLAPWQSEPQSARRAGKLLMCAQGEEARLRVAGGHGLRHGAGCRACCGGVGRGGPS